MNEIIIENNKAVKYWFKKLKNNSQSSFFHNAKRSFSDTKDSAEIEVDLTPSLSELLLKVSKNKEFNIYKLSLTSLAILFGKYTGRPDLFITSTSLQLEEVEVKNPALIFSTLSFDPEVKARDLLKQLHQDLQENISNQNYDYPSFAQEFIHDDKFKRLAFNIGFFYNQVNLVVEDLKKVNILFSISRKDNDFKLSIVYDNEHYMEDEIYLLSGHFLRTLTLICEDIDIPITELNFIDSYDKRLVSQFNDTEVDFPELSVIRQFEQQAARRPEAICVKSENTVLSYKEINEKGNQIAYHLIHNCHLKKGEKVSLMVSRSELILTGIIGIMKAGGVYIPIDLSSPKERIQFFLDDSESRVVLTEEELIAKTTPSGSIEYIAIDTFHNEYSKNVSRPLEHSDLAYMIYTSGTTGNPKGAMIYHRSLANHVNWFRKQFQLTQNDSTILINSYSFDGCYSYIWATLTIGGTLHIPKDKFFDPEKVLKYIKKEKITFLKIVPSTFGVLVNSEAFDNDPAACQSIRIIKQGGESINVNNLKKYLSYYPDIILGNHYGATECTIGSVAHWVGRNSIDTFEKQPVVGSPFDNQHVLILDKKNNMLPIGVPGEICIGGVGVGKGYHRRKELTEKKFIDHPFSPGKKLYRTGDKGRWLPTGTIEFHGRLDNQVKIRGYRVELDEIAETLKLHEGIIDSVVLVYNNKGEDQLVAYMVLTSPLKSDEVQGFLKKKLPPYMLPSFFVPITSVPLTPNGKIDRRALPDPKDHKLETNRTIVEPTNQTELDLLEIWKEILDNQQFGIDDNFFELGGHSLRATQLVALAHQKFDIKIPLREIFFQPTIRELALFIQASEKERFTQITPAAQQEFYPLSHAQKRLWILSKMEQNFTAYNIPHIVRLSGKLNLEAFEKSLLGLIERHQILRTIFIQKDGTPYQKIRSPDEINFELQINDLKDQPNQTEHASALFDKESKTVFNLEKGPLLKARLVALNDDDYFFLFTLHHIISDGSSNQVFVKDILTMYQAFKAGKENPLTPLEIHYKDYAVWQHGILSEGDANQHKTYWLDTLSGELPVLNLPLDFARPKIMNFKGSSKSIQLDKQIKNKLHAYALKNNTSIFMILLAATKSLLYHYTRQSDIIVGSPIAGREHSALKDQIGFYVNTLAIRSSFKGDWSFDQFVQLLKENLLEAYEHQSYPFDLLVDDLKLERNTNRSPLFDVVVVMQNSEQESEDLFDRNQLVVGSLEDITTQHTTSKFDLSFSFCEQPDGLSIDIEYRTTIFLDSKIERMLFHLKNIIGQITENPDVLIDNLNILQPAEQDELISFAGKVIPIEKQVTVSKIFQEQALLYPDNIAISDAKQSYTYKELDVLSSSIAYQLKHDYNLKAQDVVAIVMSKGTDFVIAMLAILKAGCAYLPIESITSAKRIFDLIEHTKAQLAIVEEQGLSDQLTKRVNFVTIEEMKNKSKQGSSAAQYNYQGKCDDLAYVMYTSGSTGEPKGVMIEHRGIVRLVKDTNYIQIKPDDVVLQTGSLSFDAATLEIWGPLLNGGKVTLLELTDLLDTKVLKQLIIDNHVSIMWFTVSWFNHLAEKDPAMFKPLRHLLFGGEKASAKHVQLVREQCKDLIMTNGYGPTENTTFSTCMQVDSSFSGKSLPIGYPITNSCVYILDNNLNFVPKGIPGEIFLGGEGLGRGYIYNEELTRKHFVTNPYKKGVSLLYKSGDLGYWREDGQVEISGRADDQLKIRGYRVEPGEVAYVMETHPKVNQAVVVIYTKTNGDKILAGYFTAAVAISAAEMRIYLEKQLPSYMLPSSMVQVPAIPLNKNGKVNKSELPEPQIITGEYVAPVNDLEIALTKMWAELLELPAQNISTIANFFELGGHSLKAAKLSGNIYTHFNVEISLAQVFATPTIKGLADYIQDNKRNTKFYSISSSQPQENYYALSPPQTRIFILQYSNRDNIAYNMPFSFSLQKNYSKEDIKEALEILVQRHDSLRTSFDFYDNNPAQFTHKDISFKIETFKEKDINLAREKFIRPFDLTQAPLFRVGYYTDENDNATLLFDIHHIITDEISQRILEKEFSDLLQKKTLPEVTTQYKDYIHWLSGEKQQEKLKKQEAFWLNVFSKKLQLLELPYDFDRPKFQSFEGGSASFALSEKQMHIIRRICIQGNVTTYTALLTIWTILLSKISNQEDISVGTPVSGRRHPDLEKVTGMFVNTLAIRSYPLKSKTFSIFLEEVKHIFLNGFENQEYPFEQLVDKIWDKKIKDRNPVFDTMFSLLNREDKEELSKIEKPTQAISFSEQPGIAKFDLCLTALNFSKQIFFNLSYNKNLFAQGSVERIITYFQQSILSLEDSFHSRILDINILPATEKIQLLNVFNNSQAVYPKNYSVNELFEKQVKKTPQNIALVFGEEELTYQALDERANQVARCLIQKGVAPQDKVGVLCSRSIEMLVGILGILKSGGVYVPLNLDYPLTRLNYILQDASVSHVIYNQHELLAQVGLSGYSFINIAETEEFPKQPTGIIPGANDAAYVMYTSGTTGKPKGVLVSHRNIVKLAFEHKNITVYPTDRVLQWSNFSFDGSTFDIYGSLLNGASLYLIREEDAPDPGRLATIIKKHKLTVGFMTTALFNIFVDYDLTPLSLFRKLLFGGERVSPEHVKKALQVLGPDKLIHVYGPTETTVFASYYPVQSCEGSTVPIGRPLSNTTVYILTPEAQLAGIGIVGEIHIGGHGVSSGYLNQEEINAEKFIPNSFDKADHPVLYKTGDLGRYRIDGNIEFIGRKDAQVKMRGYRIELGEIETLINQSQLTRQCVVVMNENNYANKQLLAYIVPEDNFDTSKIQEYLQPKLPSYMVPSFFITLDKLPLNFNGKIDLAALPVPDSSGITTKAYVAPSNKTEQQLGDIWQTFLNLEQIGIHDNFFELGGHSLIAIVILNQIFKTLNVKLFLSALYENPTIFELAKVVDSSTKELYSNLVSAPLMEHYPISPSQNRMFILQHFDKKVIAYNVSAIVMLEKTYSKQEIKAALSILVERHESLRTSFDFQSDEPVQIIHDKVDFDVEVFQDIDSDKAMESFIRPFNLSKAPLFRAGYLEQKGSLFLMLDIHHIITDGLSQEILEEEFMHILNGDKLPPLNFQYKDYVYWLRSDKQQNQLKKQQSYWLDIFAEELPLLEFPIDFPRPEFQTFEGRVACFSLSEEELRIVKKISKECGATVYMVLLSIWTILVAKITNCKDVVIGSPVAGRRHPDLRNVVGMFVNTLVMRNKPDHAKPFITFLEEVKHNFIDAFENQEYPFEQLVKEIWDNKIKGRNPIFDTMFALENQDAEDVSIDSAYKNLTFNDHGDIIKFDLSLTALDYNSEIAFNLAYSTHLYEEHTIKRLVNYFYQIIASLRNYKHITIQDIDILPIDEKQQLLTWNNTAKTPSPQGATIVSLFEEQAIRTPDKEALVCEGKSLSYSVLNKRANQLAAHLIKKGVGQESVVAVFLERSLEMLISLMAVLKSGGAYLAIDPEYPTARVNFMLKDSGANWVITDSLLKSSLKENLAIIDLVEDKKILDGESAENIKVPISSKNLAYVIYTSGSTGNPKGILIEHESLLGYTLTFQEFFSICMDDKIIQQSSVSFDTLVEEVYPALISGATIFVLKEGGKDVIAMKKHIEEDDITILSTTPMVLNWLNQEITNTKKLRWVISGGELLQPWHIDKLFGKVSIVNSYGPSEATVCATYHLIDTLEKVHLIGKPISDTSVYILGKQQEILPIGVAGELCIGGKGLARGYLNNKELTQEKFITFSINGEDKRIYKTGDWARWLPDGNIMFLGRIDHQVKINGYRIEPGEIETVLSRSPMVRECIVYTNERSKDNYELVAYIVPESVFDVMSIQEFSQKWLPAYMIPSVFMELEEIPLNSSGKIDKKSLPKPDYSSLIDQYVAPESELEKQLVLIWQELLFIDKIGIKDNFFLIGGHSILSMKMIGRIKENFKYSLSIRDLMENPTIEELAMHLDKEMNVKSLLLPLTKIIDDQPNIFMIPPILGTSVIFHPLAKMLEKQYLNCYGLQYNGFDHNEKFDDSIEEMAQSFFDEIEKRNLDKNKPIGILGYSMGVPIAFELVRLLEGNGYSCKLILVDKEVSPEKRFNFKSISYLFEREKDLKKILQLHLGDSDINLHPEQEKRVNRLLKHNNKILSKYRISHKVNASILAIEAEKSTAKCKMQDWKFFTDGNLIHRYVISNHYEILNVNFLPDVVEMTTEFMKNEKTLAIHKPRKKMTLLNLFHNKSAFFFPFLGLLGIINGIWGSALLLLINNKISNIPLPFFNQYDWIIYIVLIVVSFSVAVLFQSYMIKLTFNFGNELGLSIFNKLRFANYEDYLKLGEERVRTAIEDVAVLQRFPNSFIEGFNSLIMIVVGIMYLFWMYATGALSVSIALILLAGIYIFRNIQIEKDLNEARDLGNIYHKNVVDFLRGFKELKMNIKRSDNIFINYLTKNRSNFVKLQIKSITRALSNELMGVYAWYIMIGVVLFLLPVIFSLSLAVKTSFLVTLLFLMGPINTLIGLMDEFIRMRIALNRLNKFDEVINSSMNIMDGHGDILNINEEFESIRFHNITYEYFDKDKLSTFRLKPINIEIKKGEIIFVTGGNGSGKSTFINILSGLYEPKSGEIYLNENVITKNNIAYYRDQLSCIFTDNYLFNENYDALDVRRSNKTFYNLLKKMKLENAITFDNENNKIMHTLSKGQQKRVALIYSIMNNKDVLIFDEWAAEQDPVFRKYFYTAIIPELKQMGKTVIAVTHDDIYFDCAERLIKFDYGEIIKDEKQQLLNFTP